jgi:hypothetical protein
MPLSQPSRNYIQMIELASRTLNVGDAFQMLYSNNGALVFTIDAGIFGEGTQISLCDFDGGVPVFAAGGGVTIETSGTLGPTAQFTVATIIRVPEDLQTETWIAVGSV